jgi:catechol 2,3-dioxygenase-like lactoylglutathione lyase family enzyme
MLEIQDLNHVNIVVQNLDKAKKFYCVILGMEDVPHHPSFTCRELGCVKTAPKSI